ncbi:3-hydroxylacyl-ACP dehydratase [Maridesulfovibrio sp. FT414]|uniref:3-hydroxylacyl-ACP dehydratase n=1 Tax=Maridesulfovibrio sp. FT414 TaxID=2979469 RepID=UPI003D8008B1
MNLPIEARRLLPHRGQMLLIDSVLTAEGDAGTALADLSTQSIALDSDGSLLTPFYIELLAQAYAAICGYQLQSLGRPIPEGYLVGVQKFHITSQKTAEFSSNELLITVQIVGNFNGFAVVEGTVSCEEITLAEGRIKVFVPQEESIAELLAQAKSVETAPLWQL